MGKIVSEEQLLCVTIPSELQSDKLSARNSEKGSAGPMSSEPSWTSPPLKIMKNIAVYCLSESMFVLPRVCVCVCVFEYLEEILDVLTTIQSRDIGREL